MQPRDFDICACGDYRHQHGERGDDCTVCSEHDGMNGGPCFMFRLHQQVAYRVVKAC